MSTPSRPVNIGQKSSGTDQDTDFSSGNTPIDAPDIRAIRAQYAAVGTPPVNIPPRFGTPARVGSPATTGFAPELVSRSANTQSGPSTPHAAQNPSGESSGLEPTGTTPVETVLGLSDLPYEEKLKVLQRHLVSKEERQNWANQAGPSGTPDLAIPGDATPSLSRKSSSGSSGKKVQREDTDPFPIPYHAPGADVT